MWRHKVLLGFCALSLALSMGPALKAMASGDMAKFQTLVKYIGANDREQAKKFVDANREIVLKGKNPGDDYSALHLAIIKGDLELAKYLIEKIPQLLNRAGSAKTPLMLAASLGNGDIIKLLVEKGADKKIKAIKGKIAYDLYQGGDKNIEKLLSPDSQTFETLVQYIISNNVPWAKKFIDANQKIVLEGKNSGDGYSALHLAVIKDRPEIAEYLIKMVPKLLNRACDGKTPLMLAATLGNGDMIKLLVEKGADKKVKDRDGKIARDLFKGRDEKADPYYDDFDPRLGRSRNANIKLLLSPENFETLGKYIADNDIGNAKRFMDANPENVLEGLDQKTGQSALRTAIEAGRTEIAAYMIKNFSDLDLDRTSGKDHLSPLMSAALRNNVELVELLIANGANSRSCGYERYKGDYNLIDQRIQKLLEPKITEDLLRFMGNISDIFQMYLRKNDIEAAKKFIDTYPEAALKVADVATPAYTDSALIMAIEAGRKEIAEYLIQKLPDLINKTNEDGETPLMHAAKKGNHDIIKLLLEKGADKTIRAAGMLIEGKRLGQRTAYELYRVWCSDNRTQRDVNIENLLKP